MLSRAAPRAGLRALLPRGPTPPLLRAYASKSNKRPPPPAPPSRPGKAPPPPRQSIPPSRSPSVSGSAQQSSPGTSIPVNKTWKAGNEVKFGGSDAAKQSTPVTGKRPQDETAAPQGSHVSSDIPSQEPLAHKLNIDEPLPGSARAHATDAQSAAENTEAPPTQPLPDLRQGIPSTFDFEFGASGKDKKQRQESAGDGKTDVASENDQSRQRDHNERDYDASAYETSTDRRRAQMANYGYASIVLLTALGTFYLARPFGVSEDLPAGLDPAKASSWTPGDMYARIRSRFGSQLSYYTEPTAMKLLPDMPADQRAPYTLVISLEDLLISSEWDRKHGYRVAKRPGVDYFIRYLSQYYELVVFSSAPTFNIEPILKKLDPYHFMFPLGRESTKYESGEVIKDISYLNRPLSKTIVIDTNSNSVKNQPENAIVISPWDGNAKSGNIKDLVALIPFLEYVATMGTEDVRTVLKSFEGKDIPEEFARREAEARKRFQAQFEASKSRSKSGVLGGLAGSFGLKGSAAMGGGMVLSDGTPVAEGLARGKMLTDLIREQGKKNYEALEQRIRDEGEQWLKEEEAQFKEAIEAQAREGKKAFSWFGGGGDDKKE